MTSRGTYRLLLRLTPHHAPPDVRLRRLLKYALRECGLKCISVVPANAPLQGAERKKRPPKAEVG